MQIDTQQHTIAMLIDRMRRDEISLQPDFQRQEVWPLKKKRALIDTILRGWVVPPIHLVDGGGKNIEVLDGQQRLSAIRDFLDNRVSVDGHQRPTQKYLVQLHGMKFRDLPEKVQLFVLNQKISVHTISDFTPEEPSELFYRLNQPTALTSGEKRNSLYGPARDQLKELVKLFESLGNDITSVGFSNVRYGYDDVIARVLYFIEQNTLSTKGTERRISERFQDDQSFSDETINRAAQAIEWFSAGRELVGYNRFNKASLMSWLLFYSRFYQFTEPESEFVAEFILLSQEGHQRSDIAAAAEVFVDRASLRVTDVSSVVYRDFALNYVYYSIYEFLPFSIPIQIIMGIRESYSGQREDISFEGVLEENLDIPLWSETL